MKLGVNIDHVATLRQARGGGVPSPCLAAVEAERGGADSITVHLREDRRHIQDADLPAIRKGSRLPINLEMALHPEIIKIALRFCPEKVCMVPERRRELTTEGGLDVVSSFGAIAKILPDFLRKRIEVSLFIDPSTEQIEAASRLGVPAIEIHTGAYANARGQRRRSELARIHQAAHLANQRGLKVHAGHGLDYENVSAVVRIPGIKELNIGHSIISRAVFVGLRRAVSEMKQCMKRFR